LSYLDITSSFFGSYDSLVETCFDYAIEQEDESLFEEVLLNELSDELKLRAARKSAEQYIEGKMHEKQAKAEAKTYNRYVPDGHKINYEVEYDIDRNYNHAKKRHRLYNFGANYNSWKHGENEEETKANKKYAELMQHGIKKVNKEVKLQRLKDSIEKSWPVQKIKSLLQSFEKLYERAKSKIDSVAPEKRNIFQKVIAKVFHYIEKLRNYINNRSLRKTVINCPVDEKELRRQREELEDLIHAQEMRNNK
jgi:hypothetical protein